MTMTSYLRRVAPLAIAAVLAGFSPSLAGAQGFQIVANSSVKADAIDKATAEKVFLKKAAALNGGAVTPVDQAIASPVRDAFSKSVLGRPAAAVQQFWQQQIFSGADVPPVVKTGDDAVIEFVKSTPGGIGYVSAGASAAGVKVLALK
jgi:ABC-type phosphate transport system substrate-binding protein